MPHRIPDWDPEKLKGLALAAREVREPLAVALRMLAFIDFDSSEHWIWRGYTSPGGYGQASYFGKQDTAHRISYRLFVGPIPEGCVIDHLCRVKACVNPAHLEAVTQLVNVRRALPNPPGTCRHGHPRDSKNAYITPRGHFRCRACRNRKLQEQRAAGP